MSQITFDTFEEKVEKLNSMIKECNSIVFFGGAGVSTASGIPDFRSKNGLYNQHDVQFDKYEPEYLLSRDCLFNNPKVFYEFYRQKMDTRSIQPNVTHYKLAELEGLGKLKAIVTQNIDGLHQKAGSKNVFEIHGTTQRTYCAYCGKEYEADYIFNSIEAIPRCDCSRKGLIRPDVTLYGENLPVKASNGAYEAISNADMLIVAGTSLSVWPAAGMIDYFTGKYIVLINKGDVDKTIYADLTFNDDMTEVFKLINA